MKHDVSPRTLLTLPALALALAACGSSTPAALGGGADVVDAAARADVVDAAAPQDAPAAPQDAPAAPQDAGEDPCATPSPCANDPRLTDMDIANCRDSLAAQRGMPCAAENAAVNACRARNVACGADGMTDFTATSERFGMNCMPLATARETCCALPASAGSPNCI